MAITWAEPTSSVFEDAQKNKKALIFYFVDESKAANWADDLDLNDAQKKDLVACIRVKKAEKTEQAAASSVIPASKLAAASLWAAYGQPAAGTFVICDEFGNEFARTAEKTVQKSLTSLRSRLKVARRQVAEHNEKAAKLVEQRDDAGAHKELLSAFEIGLTGWDESKKSAELYGDLMKRVKEQVAAARKDRNEARLKELQAAFKGGDADSDIQAALKEVGGSTSK